MKKVLFKKILVSILIVMILLNFLINVGNIVYADAEDVVNSIGSATSSIFSNVITGIVGVFLLPFTALPAACFVSVQAIINTFAKASLSAHSYDGSGLDDNLYVTPFHILFNQIPLVDINFFNFDVTDTTILHFRQAVAGWYYTMRLIASMILLVILIYLGLRMALTSIATEKAIYKKMLVDWVTSLALLFLLHYIMLFVFECNSALVNAMLKIAQGSKTTKNTIGALMGAMQVLMIAHWDIVVRLSALAIYGMLVFQTISFLISYIKRMFTIGFLIIIAPLITITYSIDKIGDGKAQALNTWLKEFSYNILLQPFQCIIYLVFAQLAWENMLNAAIPTDILPKNNVGLCLLSVLSLQFVKDSEKAVKKIFGFGKASTVGDLAVGAALTYGAIMKGGDMAKKAGATIVKTKNSFLGSKAIGTMKKYFQDKDTAKEATKMMQEGQKSNNGTTDGGSQPKSNNSENSGSGDSSQKSKRKVRFTSNSRLSERGKEGTSDSGTSSGGKQDSSIPADIWEKAKKKVEAKESLSDRVTKRISAPITGLADKLSKSTGVTGPDGQPTTFGGALAKSSSEAISGLFEFAKDHKQDIVGMGIGMFTAGFGLANGEFGDFSGAVGGYQIGKGFTTGLYKYSAKELVKEASPALQLTANWSDTDDKDALLTQADIAVKNDISRDISDARKALKELLEHGIIDRSVFNQFYSELGNTDTCGALSKERVREMLEKSGFQETKDYNMDTVLGIFGEVATLQGFQMLGNIIQDAEAMNITREGLAGMLSGVDLSSARNNTQGSTGGGNQRGTVERTSEIHEISEYIEKFKDMPVEEIAKEIDKILNISNNNASTESFNIGDMKNKIEAIMQLLKEKATDNNNEILSAVSSNNTSIFSYNDIIEQLKDKMNTINTQVDGVIDSGRG